MEYRGYKIESKKDFGKRGFLINGKIVKTGFVVTSPALQNVMPGAVWFQTEDQAKNAIDALISSNGNSEEFWKRVRA